MGISLQDHRDTKVLFEHESSSEQRNFINIQTPLKIYISNDQGLVYGVTASLISSRMSIRRRKCSSCFWLCEADDVSWHYTLRKWALVLFLKGVGANSTQETFKLSNATQ